MRWALSSICVALLLAGCSFVVTVDDASYRVSVRPLVPSPAGTPLPSLTPSPTVAPATPTATPTPGPTAWLTPTPELTPVPTVEPGGDEKTCLVKLGAFAINERTGPSATAPRTPYSPIPAGSIVKILEVAEADGYLWARNYSGWFVIRQGTVWWVYGVSGATELCDEIPGWPVGLPPPDPLVRASPGVWVGPGANRDELLRFGAQVRAAGQPASLVYGEPYTAELLLANGWFVLLRAAGVPDCPDMTLSPVVSAEQFTNAVVNEVGRQSHALVGANECTWPSATWARDWVRAAAQTAAGRGVRALVPIVWNPGAPELDWVPVLAPAYRDAPIVVIWGVNTYPVRVGTGLAVRDAYTQYTTYRYELYRHHLRGVPIVITEYARGDGSEPPDFADIRTWWGLVRSQVDVATAWYVSGPPGLGHWIAANLAGRLADLAAALQ